MMPRAEAPPPPPLIAWHQRQRLGGLLRERAVLMARMQRAAPRSHHRLALERAIGVLTRQILALELELAGSRKGKPT